MSKAFRILKVVVIILVLTITIAFIIFILTRNGDDTQIGEVEKPTDEEIQREVYNGSLPKSGDLIEVNSSEGWVFVNIDDIEKKFYISSELDCKQVGLPGQSCLDVDEDTECDFEVRSCELENIEVDKTLGMDLELDSDNNVSFLRVFYVAQ